MWWCVEVWVVLCLVVLTQSNWLTLFRDLLHHICMSRFSHFRFMLPIHYMKVCISKSALAGWWKHLACYVLGKNYFLEGVIFLSPIFPGRGSGGCSVWGGCEAVLCIYKLLLFRYSNGLVFRPPFKLQTITSLDQNYNLHWSHDTINWTIWYIYKKLY